MSQKPNPKLIGAFVAASLVLFVALVMYFASTSLFQQNLRLVLFFDQSVNGLNVGSLVKFRGVPIGSVERIMIRVEGQSDESTAIPVIVTIDESRLTSDLGLPESVLNEDNIHDSIRRGLVAQLNLESFVTGQLFVDFNIDSTKSAQFIRPMKSVGDYVVVPTLGSSLDQITSDIARIISVTADDIPNLVSNLNALLVAAQSMLEGIDSREISRSVVEASDSIQGFMKSDTLNTAVTELKNTLENAGATLKSYDLESGPLVTQLESISETLEGLDQLTLQTRALIAPDSEFIYSILTTLRELNKSAASFRALTDYLERNPDALIKGRAKGLE